LLIIGSLKKEGQPGKIDPNPAMFFIRAVVAWLNLATYFIGSHTTIIRSSVLIVSTISLTILFFLSLWLGRLKMVGRIEITCLLLTFATGILWKLTADPVVANLIMQGILVMSFIPSWTRTYRFEERNRPLTWIFAVIAYVFMTAALLVDPNGYKPFQLVNPLIPGICGNGILALLAYRQVRLTAIGSSKTPVPA
jgi:hypothetical protein